MTVIQQIFKRMSDFDIVILVVAYYERKIQTFNFSPTVSFYTKGFGYVIIRLTRNCHNDLFEQILEFF